MQLGHAAREKKVREKEKQSAASPKVLAPNGLHQHIQHKGFVALSHRLAGGQRQDGVAIGAVQLAQQLPINEDLQLRCNSSWRGVSIPNG